MSTPQIQALYDRIQAANKAYRNGTPIMTDAAYDALEDQLRKLDPNHPHFQTVGAAPLAGGGWPKVRHSIPMGSLNKAQTGDDLKSWWPGRPVCVTHKLDGISVSLRYVDGKLTQALTRGDGDVGEDITRNVLLMQGAVKQIPTKGTVYVRGEIICRKSDFKVHFQGESNPRNTAAGTAKRQSDPDKCKYLTVVAYQYLPEGVAPNTKQTEINNLISLGFETPSAYWAGSPTEVMAVYDDYIATKRDALDYEIDGLVIDVDNRDAREALGDLNSRPRGSVAFKFPHDQKVTNLRAVRWQVGSSGRVTPVAEFDEIILGGAKVKQASLHTVDRVLGLKLWEGCSIMVSRRNDVIPMVEMNLSDNIHVDSLD